jgi:chemosensory pili system protein ChpA (sensor histidine kinase/response regulator)
MQTVSDLQEQPGINEDLQMRSGSDRIPMSPPSRKTTLLVVDDDREIRLGTRLRLHSAGYDTIEAKNGLDAVSLTLKYKPDAVLLDIQMPHMNGIDALKAIRQNKATASTPVIMLSASRKERSEALDHGARFFLTKPYQPINMIKTIGKALAEANTGSAVRTNLVDPVC